MITTIGLLGIVVLCAFCGMIGFLLLTVGIVGMTFRKNRIFPFMTGISIVFLLVPVCFGMLSAWNYYQSIKYDQFIQEDEEIYKEKYPVSWNFVYQCDYGENHEKLKELVEEYPNDINQEDEEGYTIFDQLIISESYDPENLKILLDAGAKRSQISLETDGGTLFLAAQYQLFDFRDQEEIQKQCKSIRILLDHGEDVNQREKIYQHATPLMAASGYFDQEDENDVRREATEEDPWIPSREIIQYLLDAGADPKIKDDMGRTAEDYYNIRCQKE